MLPIKATRQQGSSLGFGKSLWQHASTGRSLRMKNPFRFISTERENEKTLYPVMRGEAGTWHCNQRQAAIETNEKFRSSARDLIDAFRKRREKKVQTGKRWRHKATMCQSCYIRGNEWERKLRNGVIVMCVWVSGFECWGSVWNSSTEPVCVCVCVWSTWSFEILTSASTGLLIPTCPPSLIWQPT